MKRLTNKDYIIFSGGELKFDSAPTKDQMILKNIMLTIDKIDDKDDFIIGEDCILLFCAKSKKGKIEYIIQATNDLSATGLKTKANIDIFLNNCYNDDLKLMLDKVPYNNYQFFREFDKHSQDEVFAHICYNDQSIAEVKDYINNHYSTIYCITKNILSSNFKILPIELISHIFSLVNGDINLNNSVENKMVEENISDNSLSGNTFENHEYIVM